MPEQTHLGQLLTGAASALRDRVALPVSILHERGGEVSRATLAAALNLHLLAGLLERVPSGRAYMDDGQLYQIEIFYRAIGYCLHSVFICIHVHIYMNYKLGTRSISSHTAQ